MDARWDWARLETAVAARLHAAGATESDAALTAEALVLAEADGQAGHGLSRLRSGVRTLHLAEVLAATDDPVGSPAGLSVPVGVVR